MTREGQRGRLLPHLEFGDALFSLCVLVAVRPYLWAVPSQPIAWGVSLGLTLGLLVVYVRARESVLSGGRRSPMLFGIFVVLPLMFVYFLRAAIPDRSFDVIAYHTTAGERALTGFPIRPEDFFPSGFGMFAPIADMLTGLFKRFLGYRLGTAVNLIALVWTAIIVDRFLRKIIEAPAARYVAVALVLSCEQAFFEITTYMVDLIALPLLLEATWLLYTWEERQRKSNALCLLGLYGGLSLALKLTNVVFVIPLVAWAAVEVVRTRTRIKLWVVPILLGALALPLVPHLVFVYRETGNPVFPLLNTVFRSDYFPLSPIKDGRWGPRSLAETFAWPFTCSLYPGRLSELQVYSGRLALAAFGSVASLFAVSGNRRSLAIVCMAGALLWAASTGYVRYATYIEVLGGIVFVSLIAKAYAGGQGWGRRLLASPLLLILVWQSAVAYKYAYATEWSLRPTVFDSPADYEHNARLFLRDYDEAVVLSPADRKLVLSADAWIIAANQVAAFATLVNETIPVINAEPDGLFATRRGRETFAARMKAFDGKRILALCTADMVAQCRAVIAKRGLEVTSTGAARISYFGLPAQPVYVLAVTRRPDGSGPDTGRGAR